MKRIMWSAIGIAIGTVAVAASAATPALASEASIQLARSYPAELRRQLSGTFMCDVPGMVLFNFLNLNQTQLINAATASFSLIACDGTLQTWTQRPG